MLLINSEKDVKSFCSSVLSIQNVTHIETVTQARANNVWRVKCSNQTVYIKQFLERLKSNPLIIKQPLAYEREVYGYHALNSLLPKAVPKLIFTDPDNKIVVTLSYSESENDQKISDDLLQTKNHKMISKIVDNLIYLVNNNANLPDSIKTILDNKIFLQHQYECLILNLPYPSKVGQAVAVETVRQLQKRNEDLVLFDVSPKNTLYQGENAGFCDFETTCLGNAIFDIGYFLGSLLFLGIKQNKVELAVSIIANEIKRYSCCVKALNHEDINIIPNIIVATILYRNISEPNSTNGVLDSFQTECVYNVMDNIYSQKLQFNHI